MVHKRRGVRTDAGLRGGLRRSSTSASTSWTTQRSRTCGVRARSCARADANSRLRAFEADGNALQAIEGYTRTRARGRWTIADATAPWTVPTSSDHGRPLYARLRSRGNGDLRRSGCSRRCATSSVGHAVKAAPRKRRPVDDGVEQMMATAATERPEIAQQNPSRQVWKRLSRRPTALVIFGATGGPSPDANCCLRSTTRPRGAAARTLSPRRSRPAERDHEDYRLECEQAIRRFSRREPDEDVLKSGCSSTSKYVPGVF